MPYQTVPLSIAGGTDQNKSQQANNTLTKGWYPEITLNGRNQAALMPWPGTVAFGTNPADRERGSHVFAGTLYQVGDTTLYSVSSTGAYTSIGTIDGTDRCIFSDNGQEMVISSDGGTYSYDGATLTKGDTATFQNTTSNTMLNNQWVYDSTRSQFFTSDAGDALTINGLNFASAESAGDDLVRPYSYGQLIYLFGEHTIETWWNSGVGNPPFDRMDRGIIQKGLISRYAIAQTDQFLYFLGDDGNAYQIVQTQVQQISTPSIAYQMSKFDLTNCTMFSVVHDGQDFIFFSFDTNNLTYVYAEQTREWFNLSLGVGNARYIGVNYHRVYDKDLMIDYRNGNVVEMSDTAYTDVGEVIQRQRILPMVNSSKLGLGAGKRLLMNKAKFMLQTGQGLATGQGSDPQIMIEHSTDGGASWSTASWPKVGRMGKYLLNVEYWKMVSFYDIQFRLTMSDPVFSSLHDGSIDIKQGGY